MATNPAFFFGLELSFYNIIPPSLPAFRLGLKKQYKTIGNFRIINAGSRIDGS